MREPISMLKIPAAVIGALVMLVLTVAVLGGAISMDAGLAWMGLNTRSTASGGEFECAIDDPDALRSAVYGNSGWDDTQIDNATTVYLVAAERGLGDQAAIIGLITAYQESRYYNYANTGVPESLEYNHDKTGSDHDSVGIFQQRPSAGWGTVRDLMNPEYATGKFYDKLVTIDEWESMEPTEAAQAVQISAFPDAYARWVAYAENAIKHFTEHITCTPVGGEWTHPVPEGTFWGGYRTSERPGHDGIDIGADKGAEIVAASAGTVIRSKCDAQLGGAEYSCDVDGSASVLGCGWYVDIEHSDGTATRYCHMMSQPLVDVGDTVATGQLIGYIGSSGNSGAPHLHFEAHTGTPADSSNATEPIGFMSERGVDVG
jgi:murein DD-endopeptidase MepM/ murein hydrolase activator NlpD